MEQTQADLKEHLTDQIHFLESSAESYDAGFDGEAKRLANSIRLLLHDTKKSKSLLGQLGLKNMEFYDTAFEYAPNDPLYDAGLIVKSCDLETGEWKFSPPLDTVPQIRKTKFEIWWNTPVFVDTMRNKLSRKDLILFIANQDGGAHVDPSINETYAALSRKYSLGWSYQVQGENIPIKRAERAAIRQIAHEVLKTLKPGYGKQATFAEKSIAFGPLGLRKGSPHTPSGSPQPRKKVGRNDPCSCGSGKKSKKCCGR
jgi:hypothetical protein